METSKLKNMVVLRNLPSNLVDEAIIVLKSNKKIKKLEKIEKNRGTSLEKTKKDKEYILKEAEMIVNEYMSKIENKDKKEIFNKEAKIKYKKLRKYAIVTTIICAIQTILLIVL
ncbi:putative uncharacterized protein [Clostridium sp. CAG:575]|nr:putative uncharacterized protein [Clostridium sp. CAG:575]